ncbi:class I SAM-dependent methyltransferase [Streptomyces antarcticus]|uniref:class I SAM-dependent methyltransferase n=1 Tax=Streptomyces antarcticus TaxID=2996458 RepID=UPI00226EF27C|nr:MULTISPECIES: methyltransferase domain-containing protein [unclassified Streptomyces]MCY0941428.1 methyltransferase domain-containing protein [Streptomyces sp. H34-AA3]MCZ4085058.1 methyltransferase domain-containing protein [Streptomyces sp. H34-S5]
MTAHEHRAWSSGSYARAIQTPRRSLSLCDAEGWCFPLDLERWCAQADEADRTVLGRCAGRVLDIGCGAGRLVEALTGRGRHVLGIDVCPSAVITTVCRGGAAMSGSVFDPLPDEGRWGTALLIDGNIGIGGDPRRLLRRVRALVHRQGLLLVETASADVDERRRVRIHAGQRPVSAVFPWALVGAAAPSRHATSSGWTEAERWTGAGGRHFAALRACR